MRLSFRVAMLLLLTAGCGTGESRQSAPERRSADTVVVRGPTVIAYFATTQEDASTDEVLDDFQHYLLLQREQLTRLGVGVVESYADGVLVRRDGVSEWRVPRPSVGYLLTAPGKAPRTVDGVMTDADLMEEARAYFVARR